MVYKEQIAEARQKILELEREKQTLEANHRANMQRVDEQLDALTKLCDLMTFLSEKQDKSPLLPTKVGMADAIRIILGKHPEGMTPPEIRDALLEHGITSKQEHNTLIAIHNMIKNMPEVEVVYGPAGKKRYGRKVYKMKSGQEQQP